jgi:hypothetical protein
MGGTFAVMRTLENAAPASAVSPATASAWGWPTQLVS